MSIRPKDMTSRERMALQIGDPPTGYLFSPENDDIMAVHDHKTGETWGFAQDANNGWFRYRM